MLIAEPYDEALFSYKPEGRSATRPTPRSDNVMEGSQVVRGFFLSI